MHSASFSRRLLFALIAGVPLVLATVLIAAAPRAAQNATPPPPSGSPTRSKNAGSVNVSRTSWIGNSFSGKNGAYMVNFCDAIYAAPNGTVFTNTYFEEGQHEITAYQWDGAKWNYKGAAGFAHGGGGKAIGGNADFIFAGQMLVDSKDGAVRFGLSRRDAHSSEMLRVPWKKGGTDGNTTGWAPFIPAFLALSPPLTPVSNEPGRDTIGLWRQRSVRGIVATQTRLFVSVPGEAESQNTIQVFDISHPDTITLLTSWRVPNAAQIAYDAARRDVWVLQNTRPQNGDGPQAAYVIRCFDAKGVAKPARTIALPPGANPTALTWDGKRNRLLVSDWGAAQQIRTYSIAAAVPTPAAPLGETGGLSGGTTTQGRFANAADKTGVRLFGPRALSVDLAGNVIVMGTGANGMVRLDAFTPDGRLRPGSLVAAEAVGIADADPADVSDVFSDSKHYRINYSETTPGKEAKLVGLTANATVFPQDPRVSVPNGPQGTRMYRIQNRPFLFVKFDRALAIYRFDPVHYGETAIPCVIIAEENVSIKNWPFWTPPIHQWIWRDLNGDGKFDKNEFALPPGWEKGGIPNLSPVHNWVVDNHNTLTTVKEMGRELVQYPFHGLDKWGSPIYDTGGTSQNVGTASPHMDTTLPRPFENSPNRFFNELMTLHIRGGEIDRMSYNEATDTLFLTGYSITYPGTLDDRIKAGRMEYSNPPVSGTPGKESGWKQNETYDGMAAGRLLAAYPNWSRGGRTPSWICPLPFQSSAADDYFKADVPAGIAVAGRYVFVGYRYSQKILLYDAQTGKLQPEYLLPDPSVVGDSHGALDNEQPISAAYLWPDKAAGRPNGEYIVWAESNLRARILMHRWKPQAK